MPGPMNLDPAEVDALVRKGLLSPEQAQSFAPMAPLAAAMPVTPGGTSSDSNQSINPAAMTPDEVLRATVAANGGSAPPAQKTVTPFGSAIATADRGIASAAGRAAGLPTDAPLTPTQKTEGVNKEIARMNAITAAGQERQSRPPEAGEPVAPIGPSAVAPGGPPGGGAGTPAIAMPHAGVGAPNPNAIAPYGAKQLLADSEGSTKGVQAGLENVRGAYERAGEASDTQAMATRQALTDLQGETAGIDTAQKEHLAKASASMESTMADLKARADAIKDVDPEHFWNSKSTATKIGAALSMAAGAFGAALSHTQNSAQQIIQGAMDDDVKAQQANIENAWKKVAKGTDLAKDQWAKQVYLSDQMDKERLHAIDKAKNTIATYAASAQNEEFKSKAAEQISQLDAKSDALSQGMFQRRFQFAQQQAAAQAGAAGASAAAYQKYYDGQMGKPADERGPVLSYGEWARGRMGAGAAGGGQGPLAGVPKSDREEAKKELEKLSDQKTHLNAIDQNTANTGEGQAWLSHPLNRLASHIPGTDAAKAAADAEVVNLDTIARLHKETGIRDPDKIAHLAAPLLLQPGDTDAQRAQKIERLRTQAAAPVDTPILSSYGARAGSPARAPAPALPPGFSAVSDARAKTSVRPARDDVWRFLAALHGGRRP